MDILEFAQDTKKKLISSFPFLQTVYSFGGSVENFLKSNDVVPVAFYATFAVQGIVMVSKVAVKVALHQTFTSLVALGLTAAMLYVTNDMFQTYTTKKERTFKLFDVEVSDIFESLYVLWPMLFAVNFLADLLVETIPSTTLFALDVLSVPLFFIALQLARPEPPVEVSSTAGQD